MPVMAYSPLAGPGTRLLRDLTRARSAAAYGCSAAVAHVKQNAAALSLTLAPEELQTLHAAHPPPSR